MNKTRIGCALAVGLLTACNTPAGTCDAAALTSALAAAQPGQVVEIGACRVTGTFRVPAGVTLMGAGAAMTTIVADNATGVALRLTPGTPATAVRGLAIEGAFGAAVFAEGAGAIALSDVDVDADVGIGMGFLDVGSIVMSDVHVVGPVPSGGGERTEPIFVRVTPFEPDLVVAAPPTECVGITASCTPDERRDLDCPSCGTVRQYCNECGLWVSVMTTQGISIANADSVDFTDVTVEGMAEAGVVLTEAGAVTWNGGASDDNLGLGLWASGGDLALDGVSISDTGRAFRPTGSHAAFFTTGVDGGGSIVTHDLVVERSAGYGLAHVGIDVDHTGLVASHNHDAAVWLGDCPTVSVTDAMLDDNGFAGIVVVEAGALTITGTTVMGTRTQRNLVGNGSLQDVTLGDGIQLFGIEHATLSTVRLEANERVGLVVDLDMAAGDVDACGAARDGVCFEAVTVVGSGAQLGAIAGGMRRAAAGRPDIYQVVPVGSGLWDRGIVREGSALSDAAFTDDVEITGVVAPIDTPLPDAVVAPID